MGRYGAGGMVDGITVGMRADDATDFEDGCEDGWIHDRELD